MSITRLQQARQMYAIGQRVGGIMGSNAGSMLVTPTRDGSRPGYYGPDAGHENDPGHGSNAPGNGDGNRPNPHKDIKAPPEQTMQDYMTDYAINVGKKADPRGGFFSDKTPEGKENNLINNLVYTPPTKNKDKGFFDYVQQALGILSVVSPHTALGKIGTTLAGLNKAKDIANTLGIDTKGVTTSIGDLFSGFDKGKSKGTTSTNNNTNTNNGGKGEGDGIASLENQASGYDEYILLLQKLQSGNISDSERNRFNVLKNMLGI
jgi:hypothetical protein